MFGEAGTSFITGILKKNDLQEFLDMYIEENENKFKLNYDITPIQNGLMWNVELRIMGDKSQVIPAVKELDQTVSAFALCRHERLHVN